MVVETIRKQRPEDWLKEYSAEREPEAKERFKHFPAVGRPRHITTWANNLFGERAEEVTIEA